MDFDRALADIKTSVTTCFQKYVDFSGRARRPEFWWFALFTIVVSLLVSAVLGDWVAMLVNLAFTIPSLAAGSRRLHDMGKTGWLQLLWLVPFIGWAVMIYFLVQPTVAGRNQFGEEPMGAADAVMPPGAV